MVDRWDALPRALRLAISILTLVVLLLWIRVLPDRLFAEATTGFWLVLGSAFVPIGLLLVAAVAARRHRLGGGAEVGRMKEAMRTGSLPPGIDRARWRRDLDDQVRGASSGRRMQLVSMATMAVLAVLTLLVGTVMLLSGRGEPEVVAITMVVLVLFLLGAAALNWKVRGKMHRQAVRAEDLIRELDT